MARESCRENPGVPVVMFFDEVDAIGAARGGSLAQVHDRVLPAFMAELDGLEERKEILVVAATTGLAEIAVAATGSCTTTVVRSTAMSPGHT